MSTGSPGQAVANGLLLKILLFKYSSEAALSEDDHRHPTASCALPKQALRRSMQPARRALRRRRSGSRHRRRRPAAPRLRASERLKSEPPTALAGVETPAKTPAACSSAAPATAALTQRQEPRPRGSQRQRRAPAAGTLARQDLGMLRRSATGTAARCRGSSPGARALPTASCWVRF